MTDLGKMAHEIAQAHKRFGEWVYEDVVDAIRAALTTAPEGYVLVPAEPTGEMLRAALRAPCSGHPETGGQSYHGIYRAMLAAAPEPEA